MLQANNSDSEKRKKLKKTIFIVGAAIVMVVFASMLILSFLKPSDGDTAETVQEGKKETKTITAPMIHSEGKDEIGKQDVMNAIALSLFNSGLDSSSIKESTEKENDGKTELHVIVDKGDADIDKLKSSIAEKLSELGVEPETGEQITAEHKNLTVVIDFIKDAPAEKKPEKKAVITEGFKGVKAAFVIDDCGYSIPLAEKLSAMKYPVAMAIIPYTPHSSETAEISRKNGQAVFLHQPMQPKAYPNVDPGKGAILLNMPETLVELWLNKNVEDLGGRIDGFNNHMGSALTESREKMDQVFSVMKKHTGFFVDSYTSPASVAFDECLKNGMICAQNRKFIDNESDPQYIRNKILEGLKLGKEKGSIIFIGHLRDNTVDVLINYLPEVAAMGVEIVPVKELAVK